LLFGIRGDISSERRHELRLVNLTTSLLGSISSAFVALYLSFGELVFAALMAGTAAVFFSVFVWNALGHYDIAKFVVLINSNLTFILHPYIQRLDINLGVC